MQNPPVGANQVLFIDGGPVSRPPVRWGIFVRLADSFVLQRAGFFSLTGTISSSAHDFFCRPPVFSLETS
jgi:hypothetical protein